jgi:saccharopine dehydrogenase (NAD+, L-glutamate forming)
MVVLKRILTEDSLNRSVYGLDNVHVVQRNNQKVFSKAWTMFVQLGMTDDSYIMENSENMSYRDFNSFCLSPHRFCRNQNPFNLKIDQDDIMWDKLLELDLFNPNNNSGFECYTR